MSETYFQGVGDNYPKVLDLPNTYPKGDTIFENPFFAGSVDTQSTYMGLLLDMNKEFKFLFCRLDLAREDVNY